MLFVREILGLAAEMVGEAEAVVFDNVGLAVEVLVAEIEILFVGLRCDEARLVGGRRIREALSPFTTQEA